jgi:SAM-dependent methyltransferase
MNPSNRLVAELEFHDRQAFDRARSFKLDSDLLHFTNDTYLDHETWIRPAVLELGHIHGLRLLDFGCGHAMAAVVFARLGAKVTAFDLSGGYMGEARARALANDVSVQLVRADAERLPFADGLFDRVWGNAILHHLDLQVAAPEIKRILKLGGKAVFCEPWAGNRVLNWARDRLPYSSKGRTRDEQPLGQPHMVLLRRVFDKVEMRGFQFLSMVRRIVRLRRLVRGLDWCDERLLTQIPGLQAYCRYMVLILQN